MHMHTHAPREHALSLWEKAWSPPAHCLPNPTGRNPSSEGCGGLRLNQESPEPLTLLHFPPTVNRESLARCHNAPLPVIRTRDRKEGSPGEASEEGSEGSGGVFGFRSQGPGLPRHGGRYVKELYGALKGRGIWVCSFLPGH